MAITEVEKLGHFTVNWPKVKGRRQNGNLGGTHQENGRAAVEEKRPVNEVNLCFGGSNVFHYNRWRFKECRFK